jgi:hypothetical protein
MNINKDLSVAAKIRRLSARGRLRVHQAREFARLNRAPGELPRADGEDEGGEYWAVSTLRRWAEGGGDG